MSRTLAGSDILPLRTSRVRLRLVSDTVDATRAGREDGEHMTRNRLAWILSFFAAAACGDSTQGGTGGPGSTGSQTSTGSGGGATSSGTAGSGTGTLTTGSGATSGPGTGGSTSTGSAG